MTYPSKLAAVGERPLLQKEFTRCWLNPLVGQAVGLKTRSKLETGLELPNPRLPQSPNELFDRQNEDVHHRGDHRSFVGSNPCCILYLFWTQKKPLTCFLNGELLLPDSACKDRASSPLQTGIEPMPSLNIYPENLT